MTERTYRGIAAPTSLRDGWERYLWQSGVDAAVKHGFLDTHYGALGDRLKLGEPVDVEVTVRRRWLRVAATFGAAPGSHMGLWHPDTGSWIGGTGVHRWNCRVGSLRRCLTLRLGEEECDSPEEAINYLHWSAGAPRRRRRRQGHRDEGLSSRPYGPSGRASGSRCETAPPDQERGAVRRSPLALRSRSPSWGC